MNNHDLAQKANEIAHSVIITDGHIDLPYALKARNFRLEREYMEIPIQSEKGDFDYVRAKKGGLDAPFMAIFIPASLQNDFKAAKDEALQLISYVDGIIEAHPDKFAHGYSPDQINDNFKKGLISLPMGMENGAPIETISDLTDFYQRGIRYITLTHAKDNHICDSSYDTTRTWNGLSPFGIEVVKEMNRIGMIIDVSHISDETFYQVMQISTAPVAATHSSCRHFTPGWERNMDDDMIRLLASKGGVIQINFGSDFLDEKVAKARKSFQRDLKEHLVANGLVDGTAEADAATKKFSSTYPPVYSDVERVADHIDHVKNLVGVDHIGIGSDYDGLGDSLPVGLKDVSSYPNLIAELLSRGYTQDQIEKICYKNVWRVWSQVLDNATN